MPILRAISTLIRRAYFQPKSTVTDRYLAHASLGWQVLSDFKQELFKYS